MRYKVTGGQDGTSGVEVGGRHYEPGETVELPGPKASWLIEKGYLEPADGKGSKTVETAPAEPEPAPAQSDATETATDGNQADLDPEVAE